MSRQMGALRHSFLLWCRMLSGAVTPQQWPLLIPPQPPCYFCCQFRFNSFVQYSSDPLYIILKAKKLKHESCEENLTGVWAFDAPLQTMSCVLEQTFSAQLDCKTLPKPPSSITSCVAVLQMSSYCQKTLSPSTGPRDSSITEVSQVILKLQWFFLDWYDPYLNVERCRM